MLFSEFSELCNRLEGVSGRLDMIDMVSRALPRLNDEEMPVFVRFIMGRVFPDWSQDKMGVGPNLLFEAVAYVVGKKKERVVDLINRKGDVGLAIEELLGSKEQTSFFLTPLDLNEVYRDFIYIAGVGGVRSQREKMKGLRRLFANATPCEGRYLARLLLGELRIGIGEGNMRDAISKAFGVPPELVGHAYQALNDLGEVAFLARKGERALKDVHIEPLRPVKMMLAQQGTIEEMIKEHGEIAAEYKYDGARFQFHKIGNECHIYSRKLEEVTDAIPDVVEQLSNATDHHVILDGEVIAIRNGSPLPFQFVLRRFRRKHGISEHIENIELIPIVFDILYADGKTLIDLPLSSRREELESVLTAHLAPQMVSGEEASIEQFYRSALDAGHEGIMLKNLSSAYTPGIRGKNWVKIKPEVDTLDLAVIGAEWGEGRRAHLFGSFLLACIDRGELIAVSKVATGFSDDMLAELYEILKDTILSSSGKQVMFEPMLVFEVGYSEIQKSPNYPGGYALRFPRFIRVREDKNIEDVETIEQLKEKYELQIKSK